MSDPWDLVVIGGGINGTAVARAAALGGVRVALVEQGDLAGATSSASTKLIHGGLRYLEHREFALVRESLRERAVLLRTAPHLVSPLEFRIVPGRWSRPWPVLRAGLWLYDLLALGGGLPVSRVVRGGTRTLAYWDARVDDARLVVLNARDAADHGAAIHTRTRLVSGRREGGLWRLEVAGSGLDLFARRLVNAAGPWVAQVLGEALGQKARAGVRLVRGSHLVLRRRLPGPQARLLQMDDRRIVFAIPYHDEFTLVGTTDSPVAGPDDAAPSPDEVAYLLAAAAEVFGGPVAGQEIAWRYGGIRALHDDGAADPSAVTRDFHLETDAANGLLSVFGGKLTTARLLADRVLASLGLPAGPTRAAPLPGGDIASLAELERAIAARLPCVPQHTVRRMACAYGSRVWEILAGVRTVDDLGHHFGHGLHAREVDYLQSHEWARTAEDVLWRRGKLGLRFTPDQVRDLEAYMKGRP